MFAKLYDTEEHGQILVKLDQSESDDHSGPEIRYYFEPEGLGVCSIAINAVDTDKGWEAAERIFTETTEERATATVAAAKEKYFKGFSAALNDEEE